MYIYKFQILLKYLIILYYNKKIKLFNLFKFKIHKRNYFEKYKNILKNDNENITIFLFNKIMSRIILNINI